MTILPFFPDEKYLQNKWWHQLLKALFVILAILALASAILLPTIYFDKITFHLFTKFEALLTVPMLPYLIILIPNSSSFNASSEAANSFFGYLLLESYFISMIFIPSLIYRFILSQVVSAKRKKLR